jgi:DNA-binding NarL/FixJ family response regulator
MIADDSALIRDGLARLLGDEGIEVIDCFPDTDGLVDAVCDHQPDVLIVDIRMPPTFTTEGLVAASEVRRRSPRTGVLVLSQHIETTYALDLLADGAAGVGYLLKDRVTVIEDFLDSLRRVAAGGSAIDPEVVSRLLRRSRRTRPLDRLTGREGEVLALMAEGHSNAAIADRLVVNQRTVETHVGNIFTKLDLLPEPSIDRRVRAVMLWLEGAGVES